MIWNKIIWKRFFLNFYNCIFFWFFLLFFVLIYKVERVVKLDHKLINEKLWNIIFLSCVNIENLYLIVFEQRTSLEWNCRCWPWQNVWSLTWSWDDYCKSWIINKERLFELPRKITSDDLIFWKSTQ